jgi:hypothetical protein
MASITDVCPCRAAHCALVVRLVHVTPAANAREADRWHRSRNTHAWPSASRRPSYKYRRVPAVPRERQHSHEARASARKHTHTPTHKQTHSPTRASTHTHTPTHTRCTSACENAFAERSEGRRMCTMTRVHKHMRTNTQAAVPTRARALTHAPTHTHMHTHTHTQRHTQTSIRTRIRTRIRALTSLHKRKKP